MSDEFFLRALVAGIALAVIAAPLGCFVVWRRLAYFGETMAHSALLGVALGLLAGVSVNLTVLAVALAVALALTWLSSNRSLPADSLLGMLAHVALALGMVVLAFLDGVQFDVQGLLFGDILAVSKSDVAVILAGVAGLAVMLAWSWRELLAATVSDEIAQAEGVNPLRARLVITVAVAGVVAIALKLVGALLITALLIVPASAARAVTRSPETMAGAAAAIGIACVAAGLYSSAYWDTPSGPSIVVATAIAFAVALAVGKWRSGRHGQG